MATNPATTNKPSDTSANKPAETSANLPAVEGKAKNTMTFSNGQTFRAVKRVVLPLLKLPAGASCAVRVETPIYLGKEIKQTAGGGQKMAPAHLWNVIDYNDGSEKQMIVPSVLRSSILESYLTDMTGKPVRPDDNGNYGEAYDDDKKFRHSYVGKSFAIMNHGKPEGKRYNVYEVIEIEPVDTPKSAAE